MVNYWRNPSTCNETVGSRGHRRKTRQTWPLCRIAGCQTARLRFRCGAKRFSQLSHCENDEPQCLLTKPSRCCVSSRSDPCLWTTLCPTFCYSCWTIRDSDVWRSSSNATDLPAHPRQRSSRELALERRTKPEQRRVFSFYFHAN